MTPASDHPPAQSDVQTSTDTPDIEDTAFQSDGRQLNIAAGFEVRLQRSPIEIQAELEPIMRNPKVGAVVNFVGVAAENGLSVECTAVSGVPKQPKSTPKKVERVAMGCGATAFRLRQWVPAAAE